MRRLSRTDWRSKRLRTKLRRKKWRPPVGTRVYLPHRRDTIFAETGFILAYKDDPSRVIVGFNQPLMIRGYAKAKKLIRRTFKLAELRKAPQTLSPEDTLTLLKGLI